MRSKPRLRRKAVEQRTFCACHPACEVSKLCVMKVYIWCCAGARVCCEAAAIGDALVAATVGAAAAS